MKTDFECPNCDAAVCMGDYPDHMIELRNNEFQFECGTCRAEFWVLVEFDPIFYPDDSTVILAKETP